MQFPNYHIIVPIYFLYGLFLSSNEERENLRVESSQQETRSTVFVKDSNRGSLSSPIGGSIAGAKVFFVSLKRMNIFKMYYDNKLID